MEMDFLKIILWHFNEILNCPERNGTRPQVYKTFFMLNSIEIYHAHK